MTVLENKIVIIQDSISLPELRHLGWGWDITGPITHPTAMPDEVLWKLLTASQPVKYMYALKPGDYSRRVLINLDNYTKTNDELFGVTPEPFVPVDTTIAVAAVDVKPVESDEKPVVKEVADTDVTETVSVVTETDTTEAAEVTEEKPAEEAKVEVTEEKPAVEAKVENTEFVSVIGNKNKNFKKNRV